MTAEEAYIFTSFDNRTDGRARFVPHTGGHTIVIVFLAVNGPHTARSARL